MSQSNTIDKLLETLGTKEEIANAIEEQGVEIPDGTPFSGYANLIRSVPTGGGSGGIEQVQSDWTQEDDTQVDYIKNKPIINNAYSIYGYDNIEKKLVPYIDDFENITLTFVSNDYTYIPDIVGELGNIGLVATSTPNEFTVYQYDVDTLAWVADTELLVIDNNEFIGKRILVDDGDRKLYEYTSNGMFVEVAYGGSIGPIGPTGARGYSAYESAVIAGYEGSEDQWLHEEQNKLLNQITLDEDIKVVMTKHIGEFFYHTDIVPPVGAVHANGELEDRPTYSLLFDWAVSKNKVKTEAEWQALAATQETVPFYAVDDSLYPGQFRKPKYLSNYMVVPDYANRENINRISTNNGTWTVDRNGFVAIAMGAAANAVAWVELDIRINGVMANSFSKYGPANNGQELDTTLQVKKGDVVTIIDRTSAGTLSTYTTSCYFVPPIIVSTDSSTIPCIQTISYIEPLGSNPSYNQLSDTPPIASTTKDGLMSKSDVIAIQGLLSDVSNLISTGGSPVGRIAGHLGLTPTQQQLTDYWTSVKDNDPTPIHSTIVNLDQDAPSGHAWTYLQTGSSSDEPPVPICSWVDRGTDALVGATNTSMGAVKGSEVEGKVYIENDATMSVVGWDNIPINPIKVTTEAELTDVAVGKYVVNAIPKKSNESTKIFNINGDGTTTQYVFLNPFVSFSVIVQLIDVVTGNIIMTDIQVQAADITVNFYKPLDTGRQLILIVTSKPLIELVA